MSELENARERMMEESAEDLPFGASQSRYTSREWLVLIVGVLLLLAVPVGYLAVGVLGIFLASRVGFAIGLGIAMALGVAATYEFFRLRRRIDLRLSPISKVMNRNPVACGTIDSLVDCASVMYRLNVGFLVVQNEKLQTEGVVTDRDLVCGGLAENLDVRSSPVSLVMERDFVRISPESTVEQAIRLMQEHGVRRLPVIEPTSEMCLGVVSIDDLVVLGLCNSSDLIPLIRRQLSEPGLEAGLAPEVSRDNRAA